MKKPLILTVLTLVFAVSCAFAAPGQVVTFGKYYQDKEGKKRTALEWLVLDDKDGKTLLITKNVINAVPFHNVRETVTWDNSDLRNWLNKNFLRDAFSKKEQKAIVLSDVSAVKNPRFDTPVGKPTQDKVFLLSYEECLRYMPTDQDRKCFPTDYAIAHGCYQNKDGHAAWWLRSNGMSETEPEHLATWGNFSLRHHHVDDPIIGVRPSIWVDSKKLKQ